MLGDGQKHIFLMELETVGMMTVVVHFGRWCGVAATLIIQKYDPCILPLAVHKWLCPTYKSLWQHDAVLGQGCDRCRVCRSPIWGHCSHPVSCSVTGSFIVQISILMCKSTGSASSPRAQREEGYGIISVTMKVS